uniref:RING-type domain-containing protein n=1 Tax=Fundulus heteroclitus TaxID=8078 RepID=A0A3Q2PWE4_FUNHE
MEQQTSNLEREKISCSICLDVLKDPAAIRCGHSFCINCIKEHWNGEDPRGTHSCPHFRKTFRRRPDLKKTEGCKYLVLSPVPALWVPEQDP